MISARRIFDGSRKGQKIVANIYKPRASDTTTRKPITLLLAHANGFHKELWEPVLESLFKRSNTQSPLWSIAQAIALDGYNHGDSAILNRDSIKDETLSPWFYNARDILAVIQQLGDDRIGDLVGVGHSWGGASILLSEIMSPCTFSSVIITDPVLLTKPLSDPSLIKMTLRRRAEWKDIEAAKAYFEPHPFFGIWDKRVLELYIKYGLEETEDGGKLRLKCAPQNEAAVFDGSKVASVYTTSNLWRIQCPAAFLTGSESGPSSPEYFTEIIKPIKNYTHTILEGVGHLVVQEVPDLTAEHYVKFLDQFASGALEHGSKFAPKL